MSYKEIDTVRTSKLIFQKLFQCKVPYLLSLDDEEIDIYGVPYVNDKEYDSIMRNQEITRLLTINDMVELRKRGVWIKVLSVADTKTIYEIIIQHLSSWNTLLENGYKSPYVPYDDFVELDKLAANVYPYARSQLETNVVDSLIKGRAASVSLFSTKDLMVTRPNNGNRATVNDEGTLPTREQEYQSMLGHFEEGRTKQAVRTFDTSPLERK